MAGRSCRITTVMSRKAASLEIDDSKDMVCLAVTPAQKGRKLDLL